MPIEEISNEDLTLEMLPEIGDSSAIFKFGMSFNGYEHFGSLKASGDAFKKFRETKRKEDGTLIELRNSLFFCCRSSRHMQVDDYIDYYEELYPYLVKVVQINTTPNKRLKGWLRQLRDALKRAP